MQRKLLDETDAFLQEGLRIARRNELGCLNSNTQDNERTRL